MKAMVAYPCRPACLPAPQALQETAFHQGPLQLLHAPPLRSPQAARPQGRERQVAQLPQEHLAAGCSGDLGTGSVAVTCAHAHVPNGCVSLPGRTGCE